MVMVLFSIRGALAPTCPRLAGCCLTALLPSCSAGFLRGRQAPLSLQPACLCLVTRTQALAVSAYTERLPEYATTDEVFPSAT